VPPAELDGQAGIAIVGVHTFRSCPKSLPPNTVIDPQLGNSGSLQSAFVLQSW
jgi:hypothetical protein